MKRKNTANHPVLSDRLAPWILGEVDFEALPAAAVWDWFALSDNAPIDFFERLHDAVIARRVVIGAVCHKKGDAQLFFPVLRAQGATTTNHSTKEGNL